MHWLGAMPSIADAQRCVKLLQMSILLLAVTLLDLHGALEVLQSTLMHVSYNDSKALSLSVWLKPQGSQGTKMVTQLVSEAVIICLVLEGAIGADQIAWPSQEDREPIPYFCCAPSWIPGDSFINSLVSGERVP